MKKIVVSLLILSFALSFFACGTDNLDKIISEQEDKIAALESQLQEESEKNADLEKELTTESSLRKKAESKLSEYEKAEEDAKEEAQSGIVVSLVNKENAPDGMYFTGMKEIYVGFSVENKTQKDISGISGMASFYDVFGQLIKKIPCNLVKDGVKAGETVVFNMAYNCNLYMEDEIALVSTKFEKLTMKFEINHVVYDDGTEVRYD